MKKGAIVILGGMGPEASGYMYKLLIDLAIKKFGAKNNDDFPEITLYSVPVPDFISNNKNRNKALNMLKKRVELVNNSQASCVAIACNTAHVLLPKLQKISKPQFISMIDETAKKIHQNKHNRVGFLGTPSTIKYGLYQSALKKHGISTEIPSKKQMVILEQVIRNVLKGKTRIKDSKKLKKITDDLRAKGAEAIILGCTELPLIFPKNYHLPLYNSLEILAMALLRKYYGQNTIEQ